MKPFRLACLFALLAWGVAVAADSPASLNLRVAPRNLTADTPGVWPGLAVSVAQHSEEEGEQVVTKAVTGEDGQAVLELDPAKGTHFNVDLVYQGVTFSRHLVLKGGETELQVPVDIYEPTNSGNGLRALQHHVLLAPAGEALHVREIIVIEQTEKRVYVGEAGHSPAATVIFSLPVGYQDLQFKRQGMDVMQKPGEGRAMASLPVMPGKNVFDLEYTIPADEAGVSFSKETIYPTARYLVMMARGDYQLHSHDLKVSEEAMQDGVTLQTVLCEELAPGQTVAVTILPVSASDRAAPAPLHARNPAWLGASWLWALLGGVLVIVVLLIGLKRNPLAGANSGGANDTVSFLNVLLADLEEAYRDNQVTRQYYGKARGQINARLERLKGKQTSKG